MLFWLGCEDLLSALCGKLGFVGLRRKFIESPSVWRFVEYFGLGLLASRTLECLAFVVPVLEWSLIGYLNDFGLCC